jgi:hypothetical protein
LGTLSDAVAAVKELSGNKGEEMELLILPKPKSFIDTLIDKDADARVLLPAASLRTLLQEVPELAERLQGLDGLLRQRGAGVWMATPYQIRIQ